MLYNGNIAQKTIKADKERAELWLQKSAKQGNPESYIYLAEIYQIKDKVEAFKWLCLAMKAYRKGPQTHLGKMVTNFPFFLDLFEKLSPDQVAKAKQLADEWKVENTKN
jgi:TPR repeat protein